ncbi:GIY-YIG nuclease family protein [Silvanigrella sp.]|uniref:GIY-YIG nuclease family protein n=1 Tax=Silvanigrella sp. TaxID=2024976 RepID=UPI0037CA7CF1|nr:GIY-YIG nuclease family protein [Silvanigrellaceae bacterium]
MAWKLYIIQTKSGKLYTGITTNLERRFKEHCSSKKGASFFNFSEPDVILYQESHVNRSEASKRECQIKKMTRQEKLNLILQSQMKRT